jgi:AAA family ATPase
MSQKTDGCSGAELTALCQEAALIAMRVDINVPFVSVRLCRLSHALTAIQIPQKAFVTAAKQIKRQITPQVLEEFSRWRGQTGV